MNLAAARGPCVCTAGPSWSCPTGGLMVRPEGQGSSRALFLPLTKGFHDTEKCPLGFCRMAEEG